MDDRHDRCIQCLGFQHAEDAFVDDSCACCGHMSMISLRSRLSFMKGLAPSAATRADLPGSSRGPPADALGDLRFTVRASPPGTSPRISYSSRSECPVRFPGDFAGPSHGPVSLAHAHNSTRLCDSVRQATSQVQRRSRDVGGSPEHPCLARGDCSPPGKGCNRAGPSS